MTVRWWSDGPNDAQTCDKVIGHVRECLVGVETGKIKILKKKLKNYLSADPSISSELEL